MKPPHALPTPTASAPVGIEINNASAATNEIAILLVTVASLSAFGCETKQPEIIIGILTE
jgi:hypothetical protein